MHTVHTLSQSVHIIQWNLMDWMHAMPAFQKFPVHQPNAPRTGNVDLWTHVYLSDDELPPKQLDIASGVQNALSILQMCDWYKAGFEWHFLIFMWITREFGFICNMEATPSSFVVSIFPPHTDASEVVRFIHGELSKAAEFIGIKHLHAAMCTPRTCDIVCALGIDVGRITPGLTLDFLMIKWYEAIPELENLIMHSQFPNAHTEFKAWIGSEPRFSMADVPVECVHTIVDLVHFSLFQRVHHLGSIEPTVFREVAVRIGPGRKAMNRLGQYEFMRAVDMGEDPEGDHVVA